MTENARLSAVFYTGTSPFLVANEHFVQGLVAASTRSSIHASEDIYDATGLKLWAGGRPIDSRLLERLSDRRLRKPIELCVYAADPVATAAVAETIELRVSESPDLASLLSLHLLDVLQVVRNVVPSPSELMLLSVLRHGSRDIMGHAALVTAVALTVARITGVHPDLLRPLARAALLHDVGELYLPSSLFEGAAPTGASRMREFRSHPALGARVAIELANCAPSVGHLIAASHERMDGWGYPDGLTANDLSLVAQALMFAEAVTPFLESGGNGLVHAAVAARMMPGEFPVDMVKWINACARERPFLPEDMANSESLALELRQIQALLARVLVLLKFPVRETDRARAAAAEWLAVVEELIKLLNKSGIEEAVSCGMEVEPQDEREMMELSVLSEKLLDRIRLLRMRVEQSYVDTPELGTSALIIELLAALQGCEPIPDRISHNGATSMTILPWSNLFCVGVREIDDQHRTLVDLLNRLGEVRDADAIDIQGEVLARLTNYVGEHFAAEERLMLANGYADAPSHLQEHRKLSERVERMSAEFNQGKVPALDELAVFLRQWLTFHILHTDKELGIALNAKGVR